MDLNSKSNFQDGKWQNAIVILANWKDFVPGMSFSYKKVQSRFFIWSRYGSGVVKVNRKNYSLRQGDFLFLPWNHSISYHPDSENPFSVGCIHVIPDMPEEDNIYYNTFHDARPEEPEYRVRKDEHLTGFEGVFSGHAAPDSNLLQLAKYIINSYLAHCPEEVLRSFPRLLLYELEKEAALQTEENRDFSPLITNILNQLDAESLECKGNLKVIQRVFGISQATLYRIFRKYLNMTPGQYLLNRKLDFCTYLLRNTRLSNREITKKIGMDISYFNRTFKKRYQLTPGQYRNAPGIVTAKTDLFRYRTKKIKQEFHADMKAW